MSDKKTKKVALVHDFLVAYGGAERVFEVIAEMFPEAPIYTLLYDRERMGKRFEGHDIHVSWLSKLPKFLRKRYRWLLPLFPVAVESFDLRDFDLVVSSSGAWSKGIITRLNTRHVAYLHSPMRYAWDYHEHYLHELSTTTSKKVRSRIFLRMLLSYLRVWDRQAAERPDALVVNSHFTQARVKKYYRRESTVVYPPVSLSQHALDNFNVSEKQNNKRTHFLVVSRLTSSKGIAAVIEAFNKLGFPLMIVGDGPEQRRLKRIAKNNIHFLGFVDDAELVRLYVSARAVVFPAEEDFGMVAAEALSCGTPVVAYEYGGIREIVRPGETGELFRARTPEIIAEGVRRFLENEVRYDRMVMKQSVAHFTKEQFKSRVRECIQNHSKQSK